MINSAFIESLHFSKDVLHIIVILLLAWVLLLVSRKLIGLFRNFLKKSAGSAEDERRIETLARMFRYVATVLIALVAGMLEIGRAHV